MALSLTYLGRIASDADIEIPVYETYEQPRTAYTRQPITTEVFTTPVATEPVVAPLPAPEPAPQPAPSLFTLFTPLVQPTTVAPEPTPPPPEPLPVTPVLPPTMLDPYAPEPTPPPEPSPYPTPIMIDPVFTTNATMAPYMTPAPLEPAPMPFPAPLTPPSMPDPIPPAPTPMPQPVEQPSAGPRIEPQVTTPSPIVPLAPTAVVGLTPVGKIAIGIGLLVGVGLAARAISKRRR